MSSTGNPTAESTITMVTRPACGTPAAPMDAAVAVILEENDKGSVFTCNSPRLNLNSNPYISPLIGQDVLLNQSNDLVLY